MATAHPIQTVAASDSNSRTQREPSDPSGLSRETRTGGSDDEGSTLVMSGLSGMETARRIGETDELSLSPSLSRMPVALAVAVPVRDFRVRNLLAMTPGEVIATRWGNGEDLPLSAADVQLAWTEFEVVETRLAVRVTRLA